MKLDHFNLVVRENGDTGDSMAETSRLSILIKHRDVRLWRFETPKGYKRHPDSPWPESDMSNDQYLPWLLATRIGGYDAWVFIPGTRTLMQPATIAVKNKWWTVLNWLNIVQGWLLALPFRWSDDESEGRGFRSSKNKVQDYLNMIVIWYFLKQNGKRATLPRPARECYWAVWRYYARGHDPEPDSKWLRRLYFNALKGGYNEPHQVHRSR